MISVMHRPILSRPLPTVISRRAVKNKGYSGGLAHTVPEIQPVKISPQIRAKLQTPALPSTHPPFPFPNLLLPLPSTLLPSRPLPILPLILCAQSTNLYKATSKRSSLLWDRKTFLLELLWCSLLFAIFYRVF